MQTLDVISVNIWQILISLINLFLLFLIVKKFLFKPVNNVLEKRQQELDSQYEEAEKVNISAQENKEKWEAMLSGANAEADKILSDATENAKFRSDKIIEEANYRAKSIIRVAQSEAELERKKVSDDLKRQIVEVSGAMAEKMLEREIKPEDHKQMIDSFIEEIGEDDEGNK